MNKFFFLEPSKVGSQHITLLEGYLDALLKADLHQLDFELRLVCSPKTYQCLSASLRERLSYRPITVMDPHKRKLVRKSIVEFWCVACHLWKLRPGDKLLVTSLLPTTLYFIEFLCRLFRCRGAYFVLHGELEALLDASLRSDPRSYGFWTWNWWQSRSTDSPTNVVVIDDFIRSRLLQEGAGKLRRDRCLVLDHPVSTVNVREAPDATGRICFIGYRSRHKGFDGFVEMAATHPELTFVAIGDGRVDTMVSGMTRKLKDSQAFLEEVGTCDAAVFPYTQGYDVSLSAAALDALSAGLLVIATDRGCFRALGDRYGSEVVQIYRNSAELSGILRRLQLSASSAKARRRQLVRQAGVGRENLVSQVQELLRHDRDYQETK